MRRILLAVLLLLVSAIPAFAAGSVRVAYAGSMGVVMDRHLGPAFAKTNDVIYQGIGQGSYALARLIAGRQLEADVFVAITPGPAMVLLKAGLIAQAVPVASTAMVIAYSPKSRFARTFAGGEAWWRVLESPGLRFGRTDPSTDPQGRNIIFTMLLAERYYHQPDLAARILGPVVNHAQIFAEASILSRLEAGQLDASSAYQSAAISHRLPFVRLPDEINLSDPAMEQDWYGTVHFSIPEPNGKSRRAHTEPLVFYAAVLKDAPHPMLARKLVAFLSSPAGQALFGRSGYGPPKGGPIR
ncbi:MAG: extracellular solute-binding protein [Acetobacteraceae bacterium]